MSTVFYGSRGNIKVSSDCRVKNDTWLVGMSWPFVPPDKAREGCDCDACNEARKGPNCSNCGERSLRQEPKHDAWSCLNCGFEIHGELVAR